MGVKRPLEEENLTELSFGQSIQHDSKRKLTLVLEDSPTVDSPDSSLSYNIPGFVDFNIPRLPPQQFDDSYAYSLNGYPRKEVPIGPNHQAEVPEWDASLFNLIKDEREQILMGNCICPSPSLNDLSINAYTVGRGRTDCLCPDTGSVRCVQQHVRESRERLRCTIGDETFTKLGFCEMGEDVVARRWSWDDEQLFHRVVISNPASLGRDFWKHLTFVFPDRTMKELVSYYFNVFMLRWRAVQNRSYLLQIDSDDDEEVKFVGGGEDSDVGSFSGSDLDGEWVDCCASESEYVCEDNGNCCNQYISNGILTKRNNVSVTKQDGLHVDDGTTPISGPEKGN